MFCTKSGYDKFPESFFLNQILYIDIAGAKSEALDNIYSLFKQNIKSCNAKRLSFVHFFAVAESTEEMAYLSDYSGDFIL